MKKHLGLITAIGLVTTASSTVIACNKKQNDSPSKMSLKKLINQAKPIVEGYEGDRNETKFQRLDTALWSAEECHWSSKSKDSDYLESYTKLDVALKDFQHPGYAEQRERLLNLVNEAIRTVKEDHTSKTPKVISELKKALREAQEVLDNEVDPLKIRFAYKNLDWYHRQYKQNKGEDNKLSI